MRAEQFFSSVSPKGQITLPIEIRRKLGIKPKDQVVIEVENDTVRVKRIGRLGDYFQTVPALDRRRTWKEIEEIAHDEHAEHAVSEGLGR